MAKGFEIVVENKLVTGKRDINIYHHSGSCAYMIGYGSSAAVILENAEKGDYLHISVVRGPDDLQKECRLNLPAWADFEFSSNGSSDNISIVHSGSRTFLKIPAGPLAWELRITTPTGSGPLRPLDRDHITFEDSKPAR
jgi:hypothetical protein